MCYVSLLFSTVYAQKVPAAKMPNSFHRLSTNNRGWPWATHVEFVFTSQACTAILAAASPPRYWGNEVNKCIL